MFLKIIFLFSSIIFPLFLIKKATLLYNYRIPGLRKKYIYVSIYFLFSNTHCKKFETTNIKKYLVQVQLLC
jgi:hypothetical protein